MVAEIFASLHPPLVAFPLVLIFVAITCEIWVVIVPNSNQVSVFSRVTLLAALLFATVAYFSGHEASEFMNKSFIVPDSAVGDHFFWARVSLFTLTPCVATKFISDAAKYNKKLFKWIFLLLLIASAALVSYTGWLGGSLVFDHGAGVRAEVRAEVSK